ncbi:MAG: LacI family DNA-binding transcriptional regulator [Geminicoccaceae bacterium]
MARRRTLKQIAEQLDLSVATVSRALGGYEDIALKTREKVAAKAKEMGYVPNSAGRMLVSGRSGFVGLVVPASGAAFLDSFIGQFVLGLGEGLAADGCDLFMSIASEGRSELDVIQKLVYSGRADGLVLIRIAENDKRVRFLAERGVPFVAHGRLVDSDISYSWLDTDGGVAFAEAFERLYALGHRRFALATIAEPMNARRQREAGLKDSITVMDDPTVSLRIIRRQRSDLDTIRSDVATILTGADRPTAVIGLYDELALIVMQEAAQLGLSIPDELSVIGFDNLTAASLASPGLSTFDQDVRGSARTIAGMMQDVMSKPRDNPLTRLMTPQFVARGSHGPAPAMHH